MVARSRSRGSRSKPGRTKRLSQRAPVRTAHGGPTVPATDITTQHEAIAARIVQDRMEAFMEALRSTGGAGPVGSSHHGFKAFYEVVRESYDVCDSLLGELDLNPPLACQSGCVHCCFNQVSLTAPEALFLVLHLVDTRSPQQLHELGAKARAMVDTMQGKSRREIGMERHLYPCLFLERDACSVYPAHPLVCRGWNSVNAGMCRQSNQSGDALAPIENHPLLRMLAESVQLGLLHGANALGLEAGYLLLPRAMALLLGEDVEKNLLDFTDDWLRGKPFFARKRDW